MVITIEPGIYVPPIPKFPEHFHNLSVRIEDEVVIGEEQPTVLSVSAPKEVCYPHSVLLRFLTNLIFSWLMLRVLVKDYWGLSLSRKNKELLVYILPNP